MSKDYLDKWEERQKQNTEIIEQQQTKTKMSKECKNEDCENIFVQYKSTDKYCSYNCASKYYKPLNRTFLKNYNTPISKKQTVKKIAFEKEFLISKKQIQKNIIETYGEVCCEKCYTKKSISFSTHHIIYRSEKPNHKELNNPLNLIYLCYECHESYHKNKKSRNELISFRELDKVFNEPIWGFA